MNFVFVDETGDPGGNQQGGSFAHFGMALLCVNAVHYEAIRQLLSQVRWLSGVFTELKLAPKPVLGQNRLRGLSEISRAGIVSASGCFL